MKVQTGKARLSYANLAEAKTNKNDVNGIPYYSTQIIIPKSDKKTLERFTKAIESIKQSDRAKEIWGAKTNLKSIKSPLRDGDEADNQELLAGNVYFSAKNKRQPMLVSRDKIEFSTAEEIEEELYSGCYAQVIVSLYPYNFNGNKGIGAWLEGVRKIADGEPLAGTKVSVDDFEGLDDEDSAFDSMFA